MAPPLVPDLLWEVIDPPLPPEPPKPKGGRPRISARAALGGILYVVRSGISSRMLPQELGCGSDMTCWRRFRDWQSAGVWERLRPEETLGRRIYELGNGQWGIAELRTLLGDVLPDSKVFTDLEVQHDSHTRNMPRVTLPSEVETTLYRVVREGLTNVVKHARATHVSLLLEHREGVVHAILEDNGRGFDVEATLTRPNTAHRLGLRGMRERVALLGGELEIESSPGHGITLYVRVPTADAGPASSPTTRPT